MRRRFKIAFVILLVATIVWTLACYLHVQAYNQMIERYRQILGEHLYLVTFEPIWAYGNGSLLFMIGFFIIIAWIGFCAELRKRNIAVLAVSVLMITSKGLEPPTLTGRLLWLGFLTLVCGSFALFLYGVVHLVKRLRKRRKTKHFPRDTQ